MSAVVALQMGALAVVLETVASGISSLPFSAFVALMQPIHLAIGIIEGLVTATIVSFVYKARPEIMQSALHSGHIGQYAMRTVLLSFLVAALLTGGVISWFASENPDGLEWAIANVTGKEELERAKDGMHALLANAQDRIAFLPDYNFKKSDTIQHEALLNGKNRLGTSVSGLLGGVITLALAFCIGFALKRRKNSAA